MEYLSQENLARDLARSGLLESYFAVQGIRNGTWQTLFAPYDSAADAIAMRDYLADKNPACTYQAIKIERVRR